MAIGFPVKADYATGDVLSAANMNDLSGSVNLLQSTQYAAGKNALINGGFDIWQRGTSFANAANASYVADRWCVETSGTTTISRQTTGVPAGSQYVMRNAVGATSSFVNVWQGLEIADTVRFQGKTVTVSVKLRKSVGFVTSNLTLSLYKYATGNQNPVTGLGGTVITSVTISNATLPIGTGSSDWYTATITAAVPNDNTANELAVRVNQTATDANGSYWEIGQAQLELGSTASEFSRAGGTIQGELAACQRYYVRFGGLTAYQVLGSSYNVSTTKANGVIALPVPMRTIPTSLDSSTLCVQDSNDAISATLTSVALADAGNQTIRITSTGVSLNDNLPGVLLTNNSTSGFIGFSAEL